MIPTNYYAAGSRRNVTEKTQSIIQPGITTKEEVLLRLGEPDYVSEDGQLVGYNWCKVRAVWMIAGAYGYSGGIAGGEITKIQLLRIAFDASNRVSETNIVSRWGF